MTLNELKQLSDEDIRKLAVNSLYKSKRLSNTNIDCYVAGFKSALEYFGTNATELISEIIKAVEADTEQINTAAMYRGASYCGSFTDDELSKLGAYKAVLPLLDTIKAKLNGIELKIR